MTQVTTINNETLPLQDVKKFEDGYYKIGNIEIENSGDCYFVDGKFRRISTGAIVYNHTLKRYVLKNNLLTFGIINEKGDLGYFNNDPNVSVNVNIDISTTLQGINFETISKIKGFRELYSTGEFYPISVIEARKFIKITKPSSDYKHSLPYDSLNNLGLAIVNFEKYKDIKLSPKAKKFGTYMENFTFGLEFETTKGIVPKHFCVKTGLLPLRDGSIPGLEYVTIPLKGAEGVQNVIDIAKLLKARTAYDNNCALHLHIGNIPRTEKFILAFFKTTLMVQKELFELFPLYKKYNFGLKNKNYCAPYDEFDFLNAFDTKIDDSNLKPNFDILFTYLTRGVSYYDYNSNLDNVDCHPSDENMSQKWQISSRYHIHNLIPLIFGNKQTIEFRLHTPTFNHDKILGFMAICKSLISFTIQNQDAILSNRLPFGMWGNCSKLEYVIKNQGQDHNMLHTHLIQYIRFRKEMINHSTVEKGVMFEENLIPTYHF